MNIPTNMIRRTSLVVAGTAAGLALATTLVACGGTDSTESQTALVPTTEAPTTTVIEWPQHDADPTPTIPVPADSEPVGGPADDEPTGDPTEVAPPVDAPADPPVVVICTPPCTEPTVEVMPPWVITEIPDSVLGEVDDLPVVEIDNEPVVGLGKLPIVEATQDEESKASNLCQQFPALCDPVPMQPAPSTDDRAGKLPLIVIGN